jgi:broad specificity phosphatase PhoE
MNIYLVRHAQSEGNISQIEHHDGVNLTEKGKEQARSLAARFKNIPIDIILSSSYSRARETADILNIEINKEIIYSDVLIERQVPTEIIGKHIKQDGVQSLYDLLRENFKKENTRHSDEENFEDLKERAGKALEFIKTQPYENVLVVTHGSFLRALLAYMIFGESMTGHEFAQVHRAFRNKNAGITVVEYKATTSPLKNDWLVHDWNDFAHLS